MTNGSGQRTRDSQLGQSPEPSQLGSRPLSPDNQQPDPISEDERQIALGKLNSFVSGYRDRKIPKFEALTGILTLLQGDASLTTSEKEKTIDIYIEELNSIRHDDRRTGHGTQSRETLDPGAIDKSVHDLLDKVSNRAKSFADFSGSDSDDQDDPPNKRRKIKESEMPWYRSGRSSNPLRNPNCLETCKSLRIFNKDIPGCKFWVKLAEGAPAGIPSSQWERIFRGEPIELDHFLSSLHRTSINEEGETRIGNAKISLGISDAKRRISTASEWSAAWHFAARAIAFVFPHRSEELRAYGDYIEGEFAAKLTSSHPKVILFDIAVRNLVQGGQSVLLTDQQHFFRLYSAIIMPDGIESNSGRGSNRRSNLTRASGSKPDICNRFNSSGGCRSSDFDCKYRHVCKTCKKTGHGREQCTN